MVVSSISSHWIKPTRQKYIRRKLLLAPYSHAQASPSCYQIKGATLLGIPHINNILFFIENYFCCQLLCLVKMEKNIERERGRSLLQPFLHFCVGDTSFLSFQSGITVLHNAQQVQSKQSVSQILAKLSSIQLLLMNYFENPLGQKKIHI